MESSDEAVRRTRCVWCGGKGAGDTIARLIKCAQGVWIDETPVLKLLAALTLP